MEVQIYTFITVIYTFITVLAYIVGTFSTLLTIGRIFYFFWYNSPANLGQRGMDIINGEVATFPITVPGITALLCWGWVISCFINN